MSETLAGPLIEAAATLIAVPAAAAIGYWFGQRQFAAAKAENERATIRRARAEIFRGSLHQLRRACRDQEPSWWATSGSALAEQVYRDAVAASPADEHLAGPLTHAAFAVGTTASNGVADAVRAAISHIERYDGWLAEQLGATQQPDG